MPRIDLAGLPAAAAVELMEQLQTNEKISTPAAPGPLPSLPDGSRPPDPAAYGEIRTLLSRGLTDWAVTDKDVGEVHARLEGLPPHAYRLTIEQMDRDGLLSRYVEEQGPARRKAFLDQLAQKGLIERKAYAAPAKPFDPPAPPDTFTRDPNVPKAVHAAIHGYENDARAAYRQQYGDYVDRYCDAVGLATCAAELRSLGDVERPVETGLLLSYGKAVATSRPTKPAYAISSKLKELEDEPSGPLALKAGLEVGGPFKYTAELKAGKGAAHLEQAGEVEVRTGENGVHVMAGAEGIERVGVSILGQGVSAYRDGRVRLESSAGLELGAYVEAGEGRFEEGAQIDIPGVKAWVGVEMNGLTKGEARRAVAGKLGFFDMPEELTAGVPWAALGASTREELKALGWTEAEWMQRQR